MPTAKTLLRFAALVSFGGFSVAVPGFAWSPSTQRAIAADAAALAPPDLVGQLERHSHEVAEGAVEPFRERDGSRHLRNPDGSGSLDRVLAAEVESTIAALKTFRPMAEIARRLGRVSHWVADLNNPLNSASADPEEARYYRDYLLYIDSARPRFAVVLYENAAPLHSALDLETLVQRALDRGRELYPMVGREYRRIGFASGVERFDDRSSAYGVAALTYSHAVSDAARVFRYIWLAGGGGDSRPVLDRARDRLLLIRSGLP